MKEILDQVHLRMMTKDDENFIYSSWLKSNKDAIPAKYMHAGTYFVEHKKIIEDKMSNSYILILCDNDDDTQIYGFIVVEDPFVVHFLYVKYNYRQWGLGRHMLTAAVPHIGQRPINDDEERTVETLPTVVTHLPHGWTILKKKFNLTYNPYILHNS